MRWLWNNKGMKSSLSATGTSIRYPSRHVLNENVSLYYRDIESTDTSVTFTFDSPETINAVGIAGHNAHTCKVRIDNNLVLEIDNVYETDVLYFDSQEASTVKVELETDETAGVRIGYLSVGEYVQMPDPLLRYTRPNRDTSLQDKHHGYVVGSHGRLLRVIQGLQLYNVGSEWVDTLREIYDDRKKFRPLFVDVTEHNHEGQQPIFGHFEGAFSVSRYTRGKSRWIIEDISVEEVK